MKPIERQRIRKLRLYLSLISRRVIRGTADVDSLQALESAGPRYDAPPDEGNWQALAPGDKWGDKDAWTYFRASASVPSDWNGGAIELHLHHRPVYLRSIWEDELEAAGPEGQVFIDGARVGAIDHKHHTIRYPFKPGKTYDIRAVFFAGLFPCSHSVREFCLAWIDTATEKLYHDLRVTLDIVDQLDAESPARNGLVEALDAAMHAIDTREEILAGFPDELKRDPKGELFYASVTAAQKAFDKARAAVPSGDAPEITAVGHAHIDLAWLWPIAQTHHKCVRTFATQCRLLEQYGQWIFNQSSPQAYAWVERDAPDLFEKIKEHIAAGRWEADGAMWCEADTNVPSGESLVRQLLYGKRYFREKFGVDSRMLWMPDVFGYSGALPQLMRLAGVDGFVTSKISWNEFNVFPHDTFRWRGLDGTEVATHFITTPIPNSRIMTYNAKGDVASIKGTWDAYKQKSAGFEPLMTFGWGDGGGGPTEEMLETVLRAADMTAVPGMAKVKLEKAGDLLKRIAANAERLPVWDGELYLEFHRGTYTTQAWLKRANRKNEIRLHNIEWLACLPGAEAIDGAAMREMWQDLLLCQFHDILPGSSIGAVYDETRALEKNIEERADSMISEAAHALCEKIDTAGSARPVVLFNTLSWDRRDPVRMPGGAWRDDVVIPAGGWTVIDANDTPKPDPDAELAVSGDGTGMESRFWKIRFDKLGRIKELYDKRAGRQVLPDGAAANEWQVFEDRPVSNDAWDINLHYEQHPLPGPEFVAAKAVERNGTRVAVELQWRMPLLGKGPQSTITQRVAIYAGHPRIDFETTIDWHEHHQLLKVAFPVNVRAVEATHEIQFGHLRRPTHRNTSWDTARFETCAHRFVDLSEHGYGVSLLNDCKYGHDVRENVIRLTCIKCPQHPDPLADQGMHEFVYSLLPHSGSLQEAGVIRAAAELNTPPIVTEAKPAKGGLPASNRIIECESGAVVVDTIKPAEDGDGIIVRLYESHGSHVRTTLKFAGPPVSARVVNLLEEPLDGEAGLEQTGDGIRLTLRPFQILTLRLRPAAVK